MRLGEYTFTIDEGRTIAASLSTLDDEDGRWLHLSCEQEGPAVLWPISQTRAVHDAIRDAADGAYAVSVGALTERGLRIDGDGLRVTREGSWLDIQSYGEWASPRASPLTGRISEFVALLADLRRVMMPDLHAPTETASLATQLGRRRATIAA